MPRPTHALVACLALALRLGAADFHLDSQSGSDAADGLTPATAWRTLDRANLATFQPGDRLLLARGRTWVGQLAPKGSGAPGRPIRLGAYGSGPLPKVDGGGIAGPAVLLHNVDHWEVEDLEITNPATTDSILRVGIRVFHDTGTIARHVVLRRLWVHDVRGSNDFETGKTSGGIQLNAAAPFLHYEGVLVEDCVVHDVSRVGITLNGAAFNDRAPATGYGRDVVMRRNRVFRTGGDGAIIRFCDAPLIEHNVVHDFPVGGTNPSYVVGLWCRSTRHALFQYNEVFGSRTSTDGQGYDADIYAENTVFQFNYSHDNRGGFMLIMGESWRPSSDTTIRYNLSVNDRGNLFTWSLGVAANTRIHNNVFHVGPGLTTGIFARNRGDDATKRTEFRNNVVINHGTGGYATLAGLVASNNAYFGNHPASEPAEAGKITEDPGLVAAGATGEGLAVMASYRLLPTSPLVNRGLLLDPHGPGDPWGNAVVDGAPDIGLHELEAFPGGARLLLEGGPARLLFGTTTRRVYRLERAETPRGPAWQAVVQALAGDGREALFELPLDGPAAPAQAFFRLRADLP